MSSKPSPLGHALLETALGICGLAWSVNGLVAVQLPEPTREGTRVRLLRHSGPCAEVPESDWPPLVRQAALAIQALLAGQGDQAVLLALQLDMAAVPDFHRRVYEYVRTIAPGTVSTYGDVAQVLGNPQWARAVGQAMGANPFAPVVPCHRVLAAQGRSGGFSASGGAITKLRMLTIEGYVPGNEPGGTRSLFAD